jgi:hypothetical protein
MLTFSGATLSVSAYARVAMSLSGGLFSVSGTDDVGSAANSTISAAVVVNGTTVFSTTGHLVSRNGAVETNDLVRGQAVNGVFQAARVNGLTGTFLFDIPFVFGTPFQLRASLDAFTTAQTTSAGDLASSSSNFGSTAYWGGISDVHLADGTVLTGYSVRSDSKIDWSQAVSPTPVPEPATAASMLAGLAIISVFVRRRRTIQQA